MIESLECEDEWWLPERPEQKIRGTLKFTPRKGGVLQLIGIKESIEEFPRLFNS